jgi:hypothetical protein
MSEHKVTLKWERGGTEFSYQRYPRDHTWSFDGGHTMTATAEIGEPLRKSAAIFSSSDVIFAFYKPAHLERAGQIRPRHRHVQRTYTI